MKSSLYILVVTNDASFEKEAMIGFKKNSLMSVDMSSMSFREALNRPQLPSPSIVLIDLSEPEEFIFSFIKRVRDHFKHSKIVCAGHPSDVSMVLELIKMGVKDFLKLPLQEDEIEKLIEQSDFSSDPGAPAKKSARGKIITLYSPKGGSGVTLLSANLGVALAQSPKHRVVLCDFSYQCGDIVTYLNLIPQYTAKDAADNYQAMDSSFLEGVLVEHPTGVKILPAPRQDQGALGVEHLNAIEAVLNLLRQTYDTIVIDGGHLESTLLDYVMGESDCILLVANPDVVSLKGLVGYFNKLKTLDASADKIKVIINRYNSKSQIDIREFERKTMHPISSRLPNNYALCIEAVNTGRPISQIQEKSDLSKQIMELAGTLQALFNTGEKTPSAPSAGFRMRNPLMGLKKKAE